MYVNFVLANCVKRHDKDYRLTNQNTERATGNTGPSVHLYGLQMNRTDRKRACPGNLTWKERQAQKKTKHNDRCRVYNNVVFLDLRKGDGDDAVEFIERTMTKEGWVVYGDDCVLRYHYVSATKVCLEMATEDLADKACYLNRIFFQNDRVLILPKLCQAKSRPKFSSWNAYHWYTHGRDSSDHFEWVRVFVSRRLNNDGKKISGGRLMELLNQRMLSHRLCTGDPIVAVTSIPTKRRDSFFMKTKSPFLTEMLCCFNGINIETETLEIRRLQDWHGPAPRYRDYREFRERGVHFHLFRLSRYPAHWRNQEIQDFLNERCKDIRNAGDLYDPIVEINREEEHGCLVLLMEGQDTTELVLQLNRQGFKDFGVIETYGDSSSCQQQSPPKLAQANSSLPHEHDNTLAVNDCNVYVYDLPSELSISEFCNSFNIAVRENMSSDACIERPIVERKLCTSTGNYCLTMANGELADTIIASNSVELPDKLTIKIGRDPFGGDYSTHVVKLRLPQRFEQLSHMELRRVIDQKMKDHGLLSESTATAISRCWSTKAPSASHRALRMLDSDKAEKVTYLNGMPMYDDGNALLSIFRHNDYSGPVRKFSSYASFLESKQAASDKPPSSRACMDTVGSSRIGDLNQGMFLNTTCKKSCTAVEKGTASSRTSAAAVTDDAVRAQKRIALEKENSHLKLQIEALSKSNLQKVELKAKLKKQISILNDQLSERQQTAVKLRENRTETTSELTILQRRLNDVHTSWQEQVSELALKQVEIDGLNNQVQQLQKQSQTLTHSLFEERKVKKLVTDSTHKFQKRNQNLAKESSE
eukprot:scaffold15515_cov117-Cylindrotheca_fusiformis.AAC.1